MLYRPLYRGEVVWNRSQKIVKDGTKKQRKREQSEWLTIPAPELRIVSDELWQRVRARLDERAIAFPRVGRQLAGRPRYPDESAYLLVGFTRCSLCGGPVGTDLRGNGSGPKGQPRPHVPHYACLDHKRRGKSICGNAVAIRQDILDRAILDAISEVLHPGVLSRAVEKALAKLAYARSHHTNRKAQLDRELGEVQRRLDRLVDALADGSSAADEIKARLTSEKARKAVIVGELEKLDQTGKVANLDAAQLKRTLYERVPDVTGLLGRHTTQARQMLRKILAEKIELEPVGAGRDRGYKFRGALTVDRLIGGSAFLGENTPVYG